MLNADTPHGSSASISLPAHTGDEAIGASAQRKAAWRLLPMIAIGYALAFIDRINISFASLRMNEDLHFSATVYGLGAGLFFIGYALCEVPSNLLLLHFGARRWLARIMMTWGVLATAMMLVRTPWEFYTVRLLLGIAEAGFFPGIVYYLTLWFPAKVRARTVSRFYIASPLSSTVIGVLAGWLMGLNGTLGLTGWQWLFLVEGIPPILFGFVILRALPDSPKEASWLTQEEKAWLARQLAKDSAKAHLGHEAGVLRALLSPKVWMIGLFFFFALMCSYAYQFSGPAILQSVTGWNVSQVGFLTAAMGIAGAAAMLFAGASSDRTGDRGLHCIVLCSVMAAGYLVASYAPSCVVGRGGAHMLLHGVLRDARACGCSAHGVSGRTRGSRGHRGDEHHHDVQRICWASLDGPDEGHHGQLLVGTARADCAESDGCGADACADAQPGAEKSHPADERETGGGHRVVCAAEVGIRT